MSAKPGATSMPKLRITGHKERAVSTSRHAAGSGKARWVRVRCSRIPHLVRGGFLMLQPTVLGAGQGFGHTHLVTRWECAKKLTRTLSRGPLDSVCCFRIIKSSP